jgi:hypothetical protein
VQRFTASTGAGKVNVKETKGQKIRFFSFLRILRIIMQTVSLKRTGLQGTKLNSLPLKGPSYSLINPFTVIDYMFVSSVSRVRNVGGLAGWGLLFVLDR